MGQTGPHPPANNTSALPDASAYTADDYNYYTSYLSPPGQSYGAGSLDYVSVGPAASPYPMSFPPQDPTASMPPGAGCEESVGPSYYPMSVAPPCHPSRRQPGEGWTPEEDNLLLTRKKEGWEMKRISRELLAKYGVDRKPNCLVKRARRIQGQYLEVSIPTENSWALWKGYGANEQSRDEGEKKPREEEADERSATSKHAAPAGGRQEGNARNYGIHQGRNQEIGFGQQQQLQRVGGRQGDHKPAYA